MTFVKTFGVFILLAAIAGVALVAPPIIYGYGQNRGGQPPTITLRSSRSAIGVAVREAEARDGSAMAGVVVDSVDRDGPAEKAGLQKGDLVIQFDGERVRSVRQFTRLVEETPVGRTVDATVVREGKNLDVHLTPRPDRRTELLVDSDRLRQHFDELNSRLRSFNFDFDPLRPQLGVTVQELSPQLADYFGAKQGVLVSAVTEGSPAAKAGLKAGDVITALNGEAIRSRVDLVRALNNVQGVQGGAKASDSAPEVAVVAVVVVREKKETTLRVRLEAPDRQL